MSEQKSASDAAAALRPAPPMNQYPKGDIAAQSPLHHVFATGRPVQNAADAGLVFREQSQLGLLTLRMNTLNSEQITQFERALGLALPLEPLSSSEHAGCVIRWKSPDEWLITAPRASIFDMESRFHESVQGHCALVNVSGGLTVWNISGENVVDVLKRSVPVDLHPEEFPEGKVVSTLFAKCTVTLRRESDDVFELVLRRSYADYAWRWLSDASREFGLTIAD